MQKKTSRGVEHFVNQNVTMSLIQLRKVAHSTRLDNDVYSFTCQQST